MHLLTASRLAADGRLPAPGWLLADETVREFGEAEPHAATTGTAG